MESGSNDGRPIKRLKTSSEGKELTVVVEEEEVMGCEEVELEIENIVKKMNLFTQQVSELLESWKSMFKDLSEAFEERINMIYKEQMEKWEKEIKEVRLVDSANEEISSLLHNAKFLLQNDRTPQIES